MPVATSSTMMVASAFTSGLTPSRTLEKMTIGRVLEPGPATNCDDHQIVPRQREGQQPAGERWPA